MAEIAINFLLAKISSMAEEKLRLLSGVRSEIWFIQNKLQVWKVLIGEAEAASNPDDELQAWINQVRGVVFEAEDVIDEIMLRLPLNRGRGFFASVRRRTNSVLTVPTRNELASKIQGIKSKLVAIADEQNIFRGKTQPGNNDAARDAESMDDLREAALLLEEAELEGIERPKQRLMELLKLDEDGYGVKVISVYGMGGLGKTTLVKQVYDTVKSTRHFKCCARIPISYTYVLNDLLRDMIQQLYDDTGEAIPRGLRAMSTIKLKETIKSFLSTKTFMLVLDDIWSITLWESIKPALPSASYGRVMVTTRSAEIASFCSKSFIGSHVYELDFLSETDASTLFYKKIFQMDTCPSGFEQLSDSFLEKCQGLPIAIIALSSVLAAKDQLNVDQWDRIWRGLGTEIESNPKLRQMKLVLLHSLRELDTYYKSSFLYLSVFPDDRPIEYMRLLRLWMAEGFVKETEGRTCEEDSRHCFNELFKKGLIQVAERTTDGRIKTCRIHSILREIVIQRSRDRHLAEIDRGQNLTWPPIVRRLSIHNPRMKIPINMRVSALRSLLVFGVKHSLSPSFLSKLFSEPLTMLNVLDLQDAPILKFPKQAFDFIHLKYVSLRGTQVKKISSSIKKLRNLQTLDLKHTHVTELPSEILKLQGLLYLLVYRYDLKSYPRFDYKYGFKPPNRIGNLQSLEKLCSVEADQPGRRPSSIMAELGRLTQLRKLSIIKVRTNHGEALCNSIQKLENLRSLSVTSVDENEIIDIQNIDPLPRLLNRLYLTAPLKTAPTWIRSLHNLARVHLKWSRLQKDPLEYLEDLPNLVHLELLQAYVGEILTFKAGKFKELRFLGLDNFDQLQRLEVLGAMPLLEKLIIQRCRSLEAAPLGIEGLLNLKLLEFFDMPDVFISGIRQALPRIPDIPKVLSNKWRQDSWNQEALRDGGSSSSQPSAAQSCHEMRHCWK